MLSTALKPKVGLIFKTPVGKEQLFRITKVEKGATREEVKIYIRRADASGRVEPYGRGPRYVYSGTRWDERSGLYEVVGQGTLKTAQAGPEFTPAEAKALYERAHEAGMAAGEASIPEPMIVVQRANPFDDNSPIVRQYEPVMDGPCGFAWIKVRPGNGSFARWLKRAGKVRGAAYHGGVDIWVGQFNQSATRKEAYASAFAAVLREAGIQAYADSRLD